MKKKEKVLDYIMSYMACDNNPRTGYKRPKFKRFKKKKKKKQEDGVCTCNGIKRKLKKHTENEVIIDPPALFYLNYSIFPH